MREARESASKIDLVGRYSALFGAKTAEAFGIARGYVGAYRATRRILVLPHFSGINRWYNDHDNRVLAKDTARAWMVEALAEWKNVLVTHSRKDAWSDLEVINRALAHLEKKGAAAAV